MAIHEVTQAQYEAVTGDNPSHFPQDKNCPVEMLCWNDAAWFCEQLGRQDGRRYRLPTEAEWEYAARAGTTGPFAGRVDDLAWYRGNARERTHPVGAKQPNPWGLYDMHGNAWEFCSDYFAPYPRGPATDPTGPADGEWRAIRGGSWFDAPALCRSALRMGLDPARKNHNHTIRLVADAP
jgi:formylglycine-generating enzyme required for sulfatase activity